MESSTKIIVILTGMDEDEFGDGETHMDTGLKRAEDELEDIVKPKEWEKKLAKKTLRKLKKKEKKTTEVKPVHASGISKATAKPKR